jgi:hypothetical protein
LSKLGGGSSIVRLSESAFESTPAITLLPNRSIVCVMRRACNREGMRALRRVVGLL